MKKKRVIVLDDEEDMRDLVAMILDSVPALQAQYGPLFFAIEVLSLVAFTIEYGLRVWVAAEHAPNRHASERKARWKFVSSPFGVIDLLAVLPFWLALVLPADLRVFLVFRMADAAPVQRDAQLSHG